MPAREAAKPVVEVALVRLLADGRADQLPQWREPHAVAAEPVRRYRVHVGVAAAEQIRARLAEELLHALGQHESRREGHAEAHPAGWREKYVSMALLGTSSPSRSHVCFSLLVR